MASISQCKCRVVVCNRRHVRMLLDAWRDHPEQMGSIKTIIYTDLNCGGGQAFGNESQLEMNEMHPTQQPMPLLNEVVPLLHQEALAVKHFEEVIALGASIDQLDEQRPTRDH